MTNNEKGKIINVDMENKPSRHIIMPDDSTVDVTGLDNKQIQGVIDQLREALNDNNK